jgi:hypothetical protein
MPAYVVQVKPRLDQAVTIAAPSRDAVYPVEGFRSSTRPRASAEARRRHPVGKIWEHAQDIVH